jgi:hypothetical protein
MGFPFKKRLGCWKVLSGDVATELSKHLNEMRDDAGYVLRNPDLSVWYTNKYDEDTKINNDEDLNDILLTIDNERPKQLRIMAVPSTRRFLSAQARSSPIRTRSHGAPEAQYSSGVP